MRAGIFSPSEIESLVHPAHIESGRSLLRSGTALTRLEIVGTDIIARFKGACECTTVLSRKSGQPLQSACTCGCCYGGACEHVAAAMLAANEETAIQTGLVLDGSVPADCHRPNHRNAPAPAIDSPHDAPDIETVRDTPLPRLYLSLMEQTLLVELRFGYLDGSTEIPCRDRSSEKIIATPQGKVIRLQRSRARELEWTARLSEAGLLPYRSGVFTPSGDATEWIRDALPRLAQEGFEVFGRESLFDVPSGKAKPSLALSVAPGNTGFLDCSITATINGVSVPLSALFDALFEGKKFVRLSDGSTGEIPQEWIDRLSVVFALCEKRPLDDRIVLRQSAAVALKALESTADSALWDATCARGRSLLDSYDSWNTMPLPAAFKGTLRSYQRSGYEWLCLLQTFGLGGCLADDMGLGKTVQTIALLAAEKERHPSPRASLLLVPTSLVFNWQRELRQFAPSLLVMNYHGPDRKRYRPGDMLLADVVLSTYGTLQREIDLLASMSFNYIILDEAQAIKNPLSLTARNVRRLRARHRLALSGTPIENNLSELWSLFAFLNPGMLGSYSRYATTFIRPIEKERCATRIEILRDLTRPCILRRTKAQVARELPPKTETVLTIPLLPQQRTLYELTRDACRIGILQEIDRQGIEHSRLHVLQALTRLRQICCHPRLIDAAFKGESGKFEALDELVDTIVAEKHKALVFSPFVSALNLIRERLLARSIRHEYLTGDTPDRQKPVDAFQNDDAIPLMLISLKAGGVGLNLTAADYVVLLDPWWNPAVENQAADRAYRIGQKRPVFVYKMIAQNTVEERVLELQKAKKELVDAVLGSEQSIIKALGKDEIQRLFE